MKKLTRKSLSVLLSLLMVLSVCGGLAVLANAEDGDTPAPVTYKLVPEKEPTCGDDGNIAYYEGSDGKIYLKGEDNQYVEKTPEDVTKPATGDHTLIATAAVEPSCEDGNIAYWTCETCHHVYDNAEGSGESISPNETVIVALGHSFEISIVAPTCYREGKRVYTCTRCGYTYEESDDTLQQLTHADYDGNGECDWCGAYSTPGACRYCGKMHTGTFGKITEIFHGILWFFRELFS